MEVTFHVRLFSPAQREWVPIPKALVDSSAGLRVHQINPDLLWQAAAVAVAAASGNLTSESAGLAHWAGAAGELGGLDVTRPRVQLDAASAASEPAVRVRRAPADSAVLEASAVLRAAYPSSRMGLLQVPLVVAYRALLPSAACPQLDGRQALCDKAQQPLVDWSGCRGQLDLVQHVCLPQPRCEAKLAWSAAWEDIDLADSAAPPSDAAAPLRVGRVEYGRPGFRRRVLRARLRNLGPTKATGLRIAVRSADSARAGLRAMLVSARLFQ
ncbi:unnamed protein product, partial [Protopolystoma xenopodis]